MPDRRIVISFGFHIESFKIKGVTFPLYINIIINYQLYRIYFSDLEAARFLYLLGELFTPVRLLGLIISCNYFELAEIYNPF